MEINVVVDVGNSRIKWGRCEGGKVTAMAVLPAADPAAWQRQLDEWQLPASQTSEVLKTSEVWAVAGVHPERRDALIRWLEQRQEKIWLLDSHKLLPLQTALEHPERAGIDRLLNAVAALHHREGEASAAPAIIIDAGSAVTVDYLDETGVFRGGAILPGFRLMTHALHDYTALLPLIDVQPSPPALGATTTEAMQSGIFWTVYGGIVQLVRKYQAAFACASGFNAATLKLEAQAKAVHVFLTGGDCALLAEELQREMPVVVWPEMTLEGIRLTAESALLKS